MKRGEILKQGNPNLAHERAIRSAWRLLCARAEIVQAGPPRLRGAFARERRARRTRDAAMALLCRAALQGLRAEERPDERWGPSLLWRETLGAREAYALGGELSRLLPRALREQLLASLSVASDAHDELLHRRLRASRAEASA